MRYNHGMENKQSISFRLTPEAKRIIKSLAKNLGVSQAAIIEMAIREKAKRDKVVVKENA